MLLVVMLVRLLGPFLGVARGESSPRLLGVGLSGALLLGKVFGGFRRGFSGKGPCDDAPGGDAVPAPQPFLGGSRGEYVGVPEVCGVS